MKAFVSWSGGKDSALACYRMMKQPGIEVAFLLNMLAENGEYSCSHGLRASLLQEQAKAMAPMPIHRRAAEIGAIPTTVHQKKIKVGMGIPILQRSASRKDYEKEFKRAISDLKAQDVRAGIFGDIDLQAHRDWIERVCRERGIEVFFPLWEAPREALLEEFISAGFKSRIVATHPASLGPEWLGCEIDRDFMRKIKALPHIDPCGEKGEYHTFVYDGPMFYFPVSFYEEDCVMIEKHWILRLGAGIRQKVRG